jgi:alkylation response protein AidB-like acyl-CoA dehydrogenase
MNPVLPDEAVEFGAAAGKAFAALGGVDAARRAEEDPARRAAEVAPALDALGIDDLDPRADADALVAAAALCEAAGRVALPYPLVGALLRQDGRPFAVVPAERIRVDHGDLFDQWRVAPLNGPARLAVSGDRAALGSRLGPFVTDLADAGGAGEPGPDVVHHLTLTAWQVLGTADRAVGLAVEHVTGRIQFGKPLSAFQAVQFQLADAAVAVAGLRELALFTLWRITSAPQEALTDALALRVHALDVARGVLRTCQQLHGAAGVCDEYDISVLTRHAQPALRLPVSAERTAAELAVAIQAHGFDGLFEHGGARA